MTTQQTTNQQIYHQDSLQQALIQGEKRRIDFKLPHQRLSEISQDEKASFLKDIIALGNTQYGGSLILGIADNDPYPQNVIGLPEDIADSYEITKIHDLLQHVVDPIPTMTVHEIIHLEKLLVIIEVEEFPFIPYICTRDSGSVLHAGDIYIRTSGAQTQRIQTAAQMRELIHRSALKRQEEMLQMITQVLRGED